MQLLANMKYHELISDYQTSVHFVSLNLLICQEFDADSWVTRSHIEPMSYSLAQSSSEPESLRQCYLALAHCSTAQCTSLRMLLLATASDWLHCQSATLSLAESGSCSVVSHVSARIAGATGWQWLALRLATALGINGFCSVLVCRATSIAAVYLSIPLCIPGQLFCYPFPSDLTLLWPLELHKL